MNMIGAFCGAAGTKLAGQLLGGEHPQWVFIVFAGAYGLAALNWLGVDVTKRLPYAP
jgi:hypothetical protein